MSAPRKFFWQAMQRLNLVKPKRRRFQIFTDLFVERLRGSRPVRRENASGATMGFLVTPWLQTAASYFSLECARKMAAEGLRVAIIWDARNLFENAPDPWEVAELERVLVVLREEFEILEIPETEVPGAEVPAFLSEIIYENAVRKMRGETGAQEFLTEHPQVAKGMAAHAARVRNFLRARPFDRLFISGGVWALSGIYAGVAAELGISITTFDCGPGALFLGHDGVAAHFPGLQRVALEVDALCRNDAAERERIVRSAHEQLQTRMRGDDEYRLQPVAASATSEHRWDLVVPLNLRWDSAAMCRSHLFPNVRDWLAQVLAWVAARPGVTVAIRQHPCEKLVDFRGTDDFSTLASAHAGLGERARFFAATETVNTYDLIAGAKVVLPFTSRVGLEAVMLGTPTILCAKCYYGGGVAETPASAAEYFALVGQAVGGALPVSPEARLAAAVTYFLAETCVELKTSFTPAPTDFVRWVKQPAEELWGSPENGDLLKSLLTREPLPAVRYQRSLRERSREAA